MCVVCDYAGMCVVWGVCVGCGVYVNRVGCMCTVYSV